MLVDDNRRKRISIWESMHHLAKFLADKTVSRLDIGRRMQLCSLLVPLLCERVQPARHVGQQHVRHLLEMA
jgi:hypothetical protein